MGPYFIVYQYDPLNLAGLYIKFPYHSHLIIATNEIDISHLRLPSV